MDQETRIVELESTIQNLISMTNELEERLRSTEIILGRMYDAFKDDDEEEE